MSGESFRASPQICAVIPARGGSKGIPGKNLMPVGGVPLVARSVRAAFEAPSMGRVYVSTDSAAIVDMARDHGANVIERPAEISGDTASSESALLHALDVMAQRDAYRPDILVFLQCTSPLTRGTDIEAAVQALLVGGADSAFTAWSSHLFLWRNDESGDAVGLNHDKAVRLRRQDRTPEYVENGAVYAMRVEGFLASRHRFFGRTAIISMPALRSVEVDEPADLVIANTLAAALDVEQGGHG